MFKGLLLEESLTDLGVLDLVEVTQTEVWDVDNAEAGQPEQWTATSFQGETDQAGEVAEALSRAMRPAWYANFSTETDVYVIFSRRVFSYTKGDKEARETVTRYALSVGIPESQVDWGE